MYVKVFSQILESSIAVDYEQRHIFQDLLLLADRTGVVDMTHEAIARRLNVPPPMVYENILKLEQPDDKSRSDEHEGRRLIPLAEHRDWGWKIVNYEFYRDLVDAEALRAANRERKREQRARERANKENVRDSHVTSQAVRDMSQVSQNVTLSESEAFSVSKEKQISLFERNGQDVMQSTNEGGSIAPKGDSRTKKKSRAILMNREELEKLMADPFYKALDVNAQAGMMKRWCETHGKLPTVRRFVNWLNRALANS